MTLDTAVLDADRVELLTSVVPDTEETRLLAALRTKIRAQLEAKQKEDARNTWAMSKASANASKRSGDADADGAARIEVTNLGLAPLPIDAIVVCTRDKRRLLTGNDENKIRVWGSAA